MPIARSAPLEYDALREYAVRALARRALSVAELTQRLRQRAAKLGDVDRVIELLRSMRALDDTRLAEHYAEARAEQRSVGRGKVARDLFQKRIRAEVVERAVGAAFEGVDEKAQIETFLERKLRGKNLREYLQEPKHVASLYRRLRVAGFSGGASITVLKRYASGVYDLDALESADDASESDAE